MPGLSDWFVKIRFVSILLKKTVLYINQKFSISSYNIFVNLKFSYQGAQGPVVIAIACWAKIPMFYHD